MTLSLGDLSYITCSSRLAVSHSVRRAEAEVNLLLNGGTFLCLPPGSRWCGKANNRGVSQSSPACNINPGSENPVKQAHSSWNHVEKNLFASHFRLWNEICSDAVWWEGDAQGGVGDALFSFKSPGSASSSLEFIILCFPNSGEW